MRERSPTSLACTTSQSPLPTPTPTFPFALFTNLRPISPRTIIRRQVTPARSAEKKGNDVDRKNFLYVVPWRDLVHVFTTHRISLKEFVGPEKLESYPEPVHPRNVSDAALGWDQLERGSLDGVDNDFLVYSFRQLPSDRHGRCPSRIGGELSRFAADTILSGLDDEKWKAYSGEGAGRHARIRSSQTLAVSALFGWTTGELKELEGDESSGLPRNRITSIEFGTSRSITSAPLIVRREGGRCGSTVA